MKDIICFVMLFYVMFIISFMLGCGNGEDEIKKSVSEFVDTQSLVEPEADQSAVTAAENMTKETASAAPVEKETYSSEMQEVIPQEVNEVASQEPVPVASATETIPASQDIIDVITIENQGYASDKKGPVIFSHLKHNKEYGISCAQCHHVYKDGQNQWKEGDKVYKCIACHDPVKERDKAVKLQNAFHKNCRDCHSEANREGKEAPSAKCNECHG
ncbi:MAG: cytochrome c3 family protein [Deltaproteobacteria bacterium]|nr:cytochrome c3 family protein [Deltaproteobacteria bacterium]